MHADKGQRLQVGHAITARHAVATAALLTLVVGLVALEDVRVLYNTGSRQRFQAISHIVNRAAFPAATAAEFCLMVKLWNRYMQM